MAEKVEVNIAKLIGKGYKSYWNSRAMYRVLKGGRGSKKSVTTAYWYIYHIMKHPQANALVVRQTGNTHKDSTYALLKWAVGKLQVIHLWKFKENPMEAEYIPTGQKIIFRGFDDPLKLTSITVAVGVLCWVWIEEAFEIEDEQEFRTLDESIRGVMPNGLWKQITLTYNPWVNNHWTKERFWDKEDPYAERWTTTHHINEWLDEEDHDKIERLKETDPDRYKVVGLGEYGIPGGAYFDEFRRDIHTCDSFVLPDHWRRYFAMDYGLDMLAGYWVAVDTQGKAYIYKEVYKSNLIISDAAQEIKRINGKDKIYQWLAPPDLWNRRQETGRSAMEIFTENGVPIGKANNNRVQGWLDLKEWLKPYKDEFGDMTADIVIFRNCTNLIRCLPQVQCDDRDPNDVSTEPHELTHSIDAIRYFVSGRPAPTAVAKVKKQSNFWTQTNEDQGGLMEW